jgi:AAHS family 3-hydroxyphenylpropionic acid transporter
VIGASFGGWLADRVGRKPVFIGAVLAFGLFTFATAHAFDFGSLFAVRLLVGLGFGAALPNMMAVASEISAPEKRAFTAAAIFSGMPLGGGTSALLTQLLPVGFHWRVLFIIGGLLPLVLVPALYFLLPETLSKAQRGATGRTNVMAALFGEGRAAATLLLWLTFLPTLLILYLILNWLPTLVVANGLDRAVAPQASLAFNFASVAGALLFGRIVDRFGPRWPLTGAYAALIVALMALGASRELPMILALSAAAGFFLMGANYSLYGVATSYYPSSVRGTGSGASIAIGRVGSTATHVVQYMAPIAAIAGIAVFILSLQNVPAESPARP